MRKIDFKFIGWWLWSYCVTASVLILVGLIMSIRNGNSAAEIVYRSAISSAGGCTIWMILQDMKKQ